MKVCHEEFRLKNDKKEKDKNSDALISFIIK